jgi:hypothetical protein
MSRPAPIHICFYSQRCQWSKAFIEELSKTDYHKDFRFVCVDPSPTRPALPSWLKQTPTLVIRGESEPRTDGEVMNWLSMQRIRNGPMKSDSSTGGASRGPIDQGSSEPEPYLDMEMGGSYGDHYSFLSADTTTQGSGGLTMKHNFTYLNGQEAVSTREVSNFQTTSVNQKRSKKEELLDQQMEQFMKARDQGMPQRIARQ